MCVFLAEKFLMGQCFQQFKFVNKFLPQEEYLLFAGSRKDGHEITPISTRRVGVKWSYAVIFLAGEKGFWPLERDQKTQFREEPTIHGFIAISGNRNAAALGRSVC